MANTSSSVLNAASPEEELVALVTALTKLSIDMTVHALDLNGGVFFRILSLETDLVLDKALTKLALDMTRLGIEVNGEFVNSSVFLFTHIAR